MPSRRRLALLLAALLCGGATAAARAGLGAEAAGLGRVRDPSWLPDGKFLRLVSFGQRLLVSDLYWLRTVQYIGEGFLEPQRGWRALRPLAEITTDLDPRHGYAYQMTALCLSDAPGHLQDAYRILEKGMRNVPDRWSLPLLYAMDKFMLERDYAEAAVYARRAAQVGNRPHLALLAATMSLKLDREAEYGVAAAFLEESIPHADQPEVRRDLEARLVKVRTYEVLSRIEKAVARFRERHLRAPLALEELVHQGLLDRIPEDPSGGVLRYHPADGSVESSVLGPRKTEP